MIPLSLLAACASGSISTPLHDDQLRTAWYQSIQTGDDIRILVALANSTIPCEEPEVDDPAELTRQNLALYSSVTRENARIVIIDLYRYYLEDTWVGTYPVHQDAAVAWPSYVDSTHPHVAGARYRGIDEAEVSVDEGLYRLYNPIDLVDVQVDEPAEIRITADGETLRGTFHFDTEDVSGRFRAKHCEAVDLLQLLALLDLVDATTVFE
jgi:hypothetical protein